MNITPDKLADAIMQELEAYRQDVTDGLKKDVKTVAKECAAEIKQRSPVKTGSYQKGWSSKVAYESQDDIRVIVRNRTAYQLTHLLENGHVLKAHGRVLGVVGARPHIRLAELNAEKKLMKRVRVRVRGDSS